MVFRYRPSPLAQNHTKIPRNWYCTVFFLKNSIIAGLRLGDTVSMKTHFNIGEKFVYKLFQNDILYLTLSPRPENNENKNG